MTSHQIRMRYYTARATVEYWWLFNAKNAVYFVRLGWLCLTGRLLIITTKDSESKGGYRYKSLVLSKRPVSETNTYEDI